MNRRTFFGLLAGLAGVRALKPKIVIPKEWDAMDRGNFQAWFKYYVRPMPPAYDQRIFFHKRQP